jgi:hypothetical protein
MKDMRKDAINFLRSLLKKKVYRTEVALHIDKIIKMHDRREIEILINLLLIWIRDVVTIAKTGKNDYIINMDDSDTLIKFKTGYPNKSYLKAIEELGKSINQLRKNVAPQLVLLRTALELRRIFLFS